MTSKLNPNQLKVIKEQIETDVNKRWEEGLDHHPKSILLYDSLSQIDFFLTGDYFCWKSGGDGDNGDALMYHMDIYFESVDKGLIDGLE